jgi:hypothetical protein
MAGRHAGIQAGAGHPSSILSATRAPGSTPWRVSIPAHVVGVLTVVPRRPGDHQSAVPLLRKPDHELGIVVQPWVVLNVEVSAK